MGHEREWRVVQRDCGPRVRLGQTPEERVVGMPSGRHAHERQGILDSLFRDGVRRIEVVRIEAREVGPWETVDD